MDPNIVRTTQIPAALVAGNQWVPSRKGSRRAYPQSITTVIPEVNMRYMAIARIDVSPPLYLSVCLG